MNRYVVQFLILLLYLVFKHYSLINFWGRIFVQDFYILNTFFIIVYCDLIFLFFQKWGWSFFLVALTFRASILFYVLLKLVIYCLLTSLLLLLIINKLQIHQTAVFKLPRQRTLIVLILILVPLISNKNVWIYFG